mgnify:CR=1 FL=1
MQQCKLEVFNYFEVDLEVPLHTEARTNLGAIGASEIVGDFNFATYA